MEQLQIDTPQPERTNPHPTHVDKILEAKQQQPQDKPQEKPKNKGGRPKGAKNKPKETTTATPEQAAPAPTVSVEEELRKLKADYQGAQQTQPGAVPNPAQPGQPGAVPNAAPGQPFVITGHLAMIVIDSLIPAGMALFLNRAGWNLKRSDLELTEKERKDIEPIMDACVKDLIVNPWLALALSLAGAYASKIPERPSKEKRDAEKKLREQVVELEKELAAAKKSKP